MNPENKNEIALTLWAAVPIIFGATLLGGRIDEATRVILNLMF